MKLSIKILLAALLVTGAGHTFAKPATVITDPETNTTEDRNLSGFTAVALSGSFDYYITQGSTESVKIDAPGDILPYIITEVRGGVLKVYTKSHFKMGDIFGGDKKVIVRITAKNLNSIELAGSGDVFFKGGITTGSLRVSLSGSGDITGKVTVKELESSITGSGDLTLYGRAESSKVSVVGSGDFTGRDLLTSNTSVRIVGSGDANVNVNGSLNASVSGSGDIQYSGGPKNVNKSVAGSGEINGH
jgi:hypothetical protein